MRIGIDCRTILNPQGGEMAGIGHYTYYLVKSLLAADKKNQYVLLFDTRIIETREFEQKNVEIKFFPFYQYKKFMPIIYAQTLISAYLNKQKLDVYHNPANFIPLGYRKSSVITVHDLAIFRHPDWFPGSQLNKAWSKKVTVPSSIKRAQKIIAVSQSTKRDIIKLFRVPANRIEVIYEGTEKIRDSRSENLSRGTRGIRDSKKKYGIKDKFILYVGTLEPRKNVVGLVKAFDAWQEKNQKIGKDYQLIIAGGKGWKFGQVFKAITAAKFGERIRYIGYIPPDHKWELMQEATVFVFPSLYEGFGLPVLEAMSFGAPVITSKVSSIPEITGQAAALINPRSANQLTDVLTKVLASAKLRQKMSSLGKKQARKFSWAKTARETIKVYREVAMS